MNAEEAYIRKRAAEVFKPEGVEIFMATPRRQLNNATPTQFIAAGDGARVLGLLLALAEGVTS